MEKTPFEELVCSALLDVNYQNYERALTQADTNAYTPSQRHLAWERKFLAAPFAFAKKRARPAWQRFLQAAACVVLAVSVAFGGVMAVSPTARARVQRIFAQWSGEYARFSFGGNAGQETGEWKTTWLPAGFELTEEKNTSLLSKVLYGNSNGQFIRLIYAPAESTVFGVDSEHQNYEQVLVNGTTAYLLQATTQDETSYLIWTDISGEVAFKLSTTGDAEILMPLAQGIQEIK